MKYALGNIVCILFINNCCNGSKKKKLAEKRSTVYNITRHNLENCDCEVI